MSPEAARLFFVSGLTFLVGGGAGAFATRALYGQTPDVDPVAQALQSADCKPCPQCQVCPEPIDCGELGVIPPGVEGADTEAIDEAVNPDRPGLPASALKLAMEAVKASIEACTPNETSVSGMILLDLVATATPAGGSISEATVTQATGDAQGHEITECIRSAAENARFAWEGPEGDLKFKLPVKVGR